MSKHNFYLYMSECRDRHFAESPYNPKVSVNKNSDDSVSFIFCGQKAFGFKAMKTNYAFILKNDYYKKLDIDSLSFDYELSNLKSAEDFTRILTPKSYELFTLLMDYIFSFSHAYVDEHYIPDYFYDCCHRYMECSDALRCTNPDLIHSKSCTYRKKLEQGLVFFGKNRNKDQRG